MGIIGEALFDSQDYANATTNVWTLKIFIALALILVGILLGRVSEYVLKKVSAKIQLDKKVRGGFVSLFIQVIKWSIVVVFLDLAVIQLPSSSLATSLSKVLAIIPAAILSLIIIAVGFGIAIYLREVVEDTEITGWQMLSHYIFYFVLLISGIYALKIALISFEGTITNILVATIAVIVVIALSFYHVKKESAKRY